jgi:hypothetical protein
MRRKWLRIMAGALALLGTALSGCTQPSDQESVNPIDSPVQSHQASTVAPLQQVAPAAAATLEPVGAPDASSTTAKATNALMLKAPTLEVDSMLASKDAIEKAKADLAQKLDVPPNEIDLVVVIGQQFTSDGFYCRSIEARTSKDAPAVMIAGESILLRAQGDLYEYHAGSQVVTFCRKLP